MYSIYMHNRVWRLRHTHYIMKNKCEAPHRSIALRLCRHSDGDITKNHLISGNKLLISSYTYVTDSSQGVPLFVL